MIDNNTNIPNSDLDDDELLVGGFEAFGAPLAAEENEEELHLHHKIVADKGQGPIRIDKFLTDRIAHSTRTKIQEACENGSVTVNGNPAKNNYRIQPGDVIEVNLPEPVRHNEIIAQDIPLDIVYEDDTVLVINKPAGMVVHPAYGNWDGTLVNALVWHFQNLPTGRNGSIRPGLVHRIDKDTSGLLVIAKTETAMTHLANQFFHHTIAREYLAMVWGVPKEPKGTINVNLGRHPRDMKITLAFEDTTIGKHAVTHYEVLKQMHYVSLIACHLETGRTHQIRAHMRYLGHPLFNDAPYGGDKILKGTTFTRYRQFIDNCFKIMPRQALHARLLGFVHPVTEEFMQFEAPLPSDFQQLLDKWEHYLAYNEQA
jgi:23S rRNA pseudouridine1911/1915/1917 synthase